MKNYLFLSVLVCLTALSTGCQTIAPSMSQFNVFGRSDAELTASVQQELAGNALLAGVPIQVEAQEGTVRLTGYVKTIRQSDTAELVAGKVDGVKAVQNNLIVRK
ncbi:BON domain-containing protein [Legionella dresdenensis]|uniref:BON domain-containing protein n=1 Tax=Legionella dresdenensis TaxID=450200 RepID=A0ABV8CDF4_9GAMM